jgi:uncharacterized DUF497 family protein
MPQTQRSIADIEAMFLRPFAAFPDPEHSRTEERFKAIGTTDQDGTSLSSSR